jgi:hypothetical protein
MFAYRSEQLWAPVARSESVLEAKQFGDPTEQSTLIFGDHIVDKDLSEVRNDAPVLLTKCIYRSSYTPCLSPNRNVLCKMLDV